MNLLAHQPLGDNLVQQRSIAFLLPSKCAAMQAVSVAILSTDVFHLRTMLIPWSLRMRLKV